MKRFILEESLGVPRICDQLHYLEFPYGGHAYFPKFYGSHRADYHPMDAQKVCDWLNERDMQRPLYKPFYPRNLGDD